MERWLSGRKRTIRNRLTGDCSWVRIPPSPYILMFLREQKPPKVLQLQHNVGLYKKTYFYEY